MTDEPVDEFARALVRRFLLLCENPRTRDRMLTMVRGSTGSAKTARRLYAFINRSVLRPTVQRTALPITATRWELVFAQLIGIGVLRYVVELEPIASMTVDEVVDHAAPGIHTTLRHVRRGTIALPGTPRED